MTINNIRDAINKHSTRSAWDKGVKLYALELIDSLRKPLTTVTFMKMTLQLLAFFRVVSLMARRTGANTLGEAAP